MKLVEYRLECERLAYEATNNPLHAWAAYGVARQAQVAIPEWVLTYLDKCRLGLVFTVPDAIEERGSAKDLGPVIAGAFGLVSKGRGNPFEYDERWWVYGRAVRLLKNEIEATGKEAKMDAVFFELGNHFSASDSKIRRGWKLFEKAFPEGDDHLVIDEDDDNLTTVIDDLLVPPIVCVIDGADLPAPIVIDEGDLPDPA